MAGGEQQHPAYRGEQWASLLKEKGGACVSTEGCKTDPVWGLVGERVSQPPLVGL